MVIIIDNTVDAATVPKSIYIEFNVGFVVASGNIVLRQFPLPQLPAKS